MRTLLLILALAMPARSQEITVNDDVCSSCETVYQHMSETVAPSVVSIRVERDKEERRATGTGFTAMMDGGVFKNRPASSPVSGTVIDADGWIATSHFNISGTIKGIKVCLADGREFDGTLKGYNATFDIAVIKIEATGLPVLKRSNLKEIRTGQFVAALGRAPDRKHLSFNQGIISAPWRMAGRGVQSDARMNYGNVGGPLVDRQGRLIGITCKVEIKTSGSIGQNSGIGFAVTWDKLDEILPDLKLGKTVGESRRPFLGIQANVEAEVEGVEVQVVQPGGSAEKAGMKNGDIIIEFDGKKIRNFDELRSMIVSKKTGDRIKIKVKRNGEEMTLEAELGSAPGE